jgi:hypothetical protein
LEIVDFSMRHLKEASAGHGMACWASPLLRVTMLQPTPGKVIAGTEEEGAMARWAISKA